MKKRRHQASSKLREDLTMRIKPLCLLMACIALQALAADPPAPSRISVERLEQLLLIAKTRGDTEEAKQLFALELTERLSAARLQQLEAGLPGERSRQALLALADLSSFLAPPANEIPATAAPDPASQRRMMTLTVNYLAKTLPLLPNLFATRDTTRFESRPSSIDVDSENTLRAVSRSAITVFFRNGQEFVDGGETKDAKRGGPDKGLTTWGEFGPILGTVLMDAAQSQLAWSHWELSSAGPQAVFRYAVPKEKSHYNVRFCCVTESYGLEINFLTQRTGYHGEITLDPDSGTILRLTVISDLEPGNPIARASLLVQYGPEEIGGKTYICPVRGIALAQAPDLKALNSTLAQLRTASVANTQPSVQKTTLTTLAREPQQILLNDVTFWEYHLFRTESHILTGKDAQDTSRLGATATAPSPADSSSENAKPAEEAAEPEVVPGAAPAQPPAESLAVSSAAPATPPTATEVPEIYVTGADGLPNAPAISSAGAADATTTYRINARLVDVSLVALDKKSHPLTNLSQGDLEVYDNGTKVDLRAFSQAGATVPAQPASVVQSSNPTSQPEFSNRRTMPRSVTGDLQSTIVLLIDNTLSIDDLFNVREQMSRFLKGLRANERVAVYVMRKGGFQIIQDTSTDHLLVANTLAKWAPSADSVSLGQEQEARNRQQMDYVLNTEDLLSVNGHGLMDNQPQTQSLDPQLRELGDNPGRDALSALVMLAGHLASMPGHKSLVWIASDNVLADWTNASLNIDKGSHFIEPTALRAQEAMNEAHVSVYPLDASRLEAGGLDASVANRNVQLNPAATANQVGGCGVVSSGGRAGQASGNGPELTSGADINTCGSDLHPGRITAQMQQDLHSIQGVYREIADATGGRAFRRASDIVAELNDVATDGRATYLLSFAPPLAADDKYHVITIKLAGRKDVTLRYRTGYFYRQEPIMLKDRFREAVLEPDDVTEIGLTADVVPGSKDLTVKLGIAATDLEVAQRESLWTDKLDIYLVQREVSGTKAQVSGQSMNLRLRSVSYQKYLHDGIPFDQVVEVAPGIGSIRIIVLDENSGRMGSVTISIAAFEKRS
jgi:VWFA-related protein